MADAISDFLTIIRNAYRARLDSCEGRFSKVHWRLAEILRDEGYLRAVHEGRDAKGHKNIRLILKYAGGAPALTGLQRHSRPGRRCYYPHDGIPKVLGGLGMGVLTTPKGLMGDREAKRRRLGGELICTVW